MLIAPQNRTSSSRAATGTMLSRLFLKSGGCLTQSLRFFHQIAMPMAIARTSSHNQYSSKKPIGGGSWTGAATTGAGFGG
jgi:hypothetical protein